MKGFAIPLLLLGTLLLAPLARAEDASLPFRDAFRAYVKVRELETKKQVTLDRPDLEEGARADVLRKIAPQLTEARIDFQAFLQPGEQGLSSWELSVLNKAGKKKAPAPADKAGLDFLSRTYGAKALSWTPIEWECAGDWFGKSTEDAFLKIVFGMESAPVKHVPISDPLVVWVTDPLARYLPKSETDRLKADQDRARQDLEKQGYKVEIVEVGAFHRVEEQAEGLHLALAEKIKNSVKFTLVTSGHASAVLYHALDLNPYLLRSTAILGWVNVNGRLFGEAGRSLRAPASVSKADRPEEEAHRQLVLLRELRLNPPAQLGAKFPVLNLVTLSGGGRPGADLRDSLLPEARTFTVPTGDGFGALGSALPALGAPAPAGGLRDAEGETGI